MVSGRSIVSRAWAALPAEISGGVLGTSRKNFPNRRSGLPILRGLFAPPAFSYGAKQLVSATSAYSAEDAQRIAEQIAASQPSLHRLTTLMTLVLSEMRLRAYPGTDDRIYTAGINAYFVAATTENPLDDEALAVLCASICDELTDRPELSTTSLSAALADSATLQWIAAARALIPQDAVSTPSGDSAEVADQRADIRAFLQSVSLDGSRAVVAPEGVGAWQRLAVGNPARTVQDALVSAGLSSVDLPGVPPLSGEKGELNHVPPLNRSLTSRLWQIVRSASGRAWSNELPTLREIIELEIEALGRPLHLATAEAQAGVVAGISAYSEILADPSSLRVVGRGAESDDVTAALVAQRRRLLNERTNAGDVINGLILGFLRSFAPNASDGWRKLSLAAKDTLSDPHRTLVPRLWNRLHNAQYRRGYLDDGTAAWEIISGGVATMLSDLRSAHISQNGVMISIDTGGTEGAEGTFDSAALNEISRAAYSHDSAGAIARDTRVREALAQVAEMTGEHGLTAFLIDVQAVYRRELESDAARQRAMEIWAAAETADEDAASWHDLLEYLDDYIA